MSNALNGDRPVIRCYNKPGIPKSVQARLTAEGLFVADYGSGWSLDSKEVSDKDHRPAAGNAFNRIMEISNQGGLGLIRTPNDDDEIITVGEWKPNCATFRKINGTKLKGVQMARFGLFVPEDPLFDDLDEIYHGSGAAVDSAEADEATIRKALDTLEAEGRLRQPSYL